MHNASHFHVILNRRKISDPVKRKFFFSPVVLKIISNYLSSISKCGNKEKVLSVSQHTCSPKRNTIIQIHLWCHTKPYWYMNQMTQTTLF